MADDIGGVLILSVLISLMNGKGGESSTSLPLIIMMQAIFFGGTYLLVRWLAPYLMHLSKRLLTTAAPAVMAMILCLGMASLADLVHLSGAVGAFLPGLPLLTPRPATTSPKPSSRLATPFSSRFSSSTWGW